MDYAGTASDITARVKLQYEEYPYPDYSLFIPLRTQEAYASHSLFSAQLCREKALSVPTLHHHDARVLIAGCGDILPFVLSFWEPETHHLHAVDLSENNLKRARQRSLFRPHPFYWQAGNIEDKALALPADLSHIDCYGVLHHLANPGQTLKRLHDQMLPGATMRIMVYNREARSWIHHFQRAFALLGLSAFERKDLDTAVAILKRLSAVSPFFNERTAPMKTSIFNHSSRFVDTFFHAREARLPLEFWIETLTRTGFETLGLFDRYAELDDLPNPLLQCPTLEQMNERTLDRRFENNFEIYLRKKGGDKKGKEPIKDKDQRNLPQILPTRWRMKMPPKAWFSYTETNTVPLTLRFKLWTTFLRKIEGSTKPTTLDSMATTLKPEAWQRLARLGAVFPSNFASVELQALLMKPIHGKMDVPLFAAVTDLRKDLALRHLLEATLLAKGKGIRALNQVYCRLEAAQKV